MKAIAVRLFWVACLLLVTNFSYALEFKQKDNVVLVSGSSIDFVDVGRFEKALASGVDTIVFYKIGGSRIDLLSSIGRMIQKAHVTTVASDSCGPSCAFLFMAGEQRLVGFFPAKTIQDPIFLIMAGARIEGTESDAHDTGSFAYFKDRFSSNMPHDLLNRYTTGGKGGHLMLFAWPSVAFPEGQLAECQISSDKKGITCSPVSDLTPLQVGAITSATPYAIEIDE
ncbi:MAG: hypothetical protein QM739_11625 [Propionivibrio sp.]